jgi:hypothetical protein
MPNNTWSRCLGVFFGKQAGLTWLSHKRKQNGSAIGRKARNCGGRIGTALLALGAGPEHNIAFSAGERAVPAAEGGQANESAPPTGSDCNRHKREAGADAGEGFVT